MITGNFNYLGIDWDNESFHEKNEYLSLFVNTTQDCFLYQQIAEPTRYRQEEPSDLDLVFRNEEGMVHNLVHQPGLGDCDHMYKM